MQQGEPPCLLPASWKTKWTLKHRVSYKRLSQPPSYDLPVEKPILCRLFAELQLLSRATSPPCGWWLSEAVVKGWASRYISWRHLNASGQVGGFVHPTLLLRCMVWLHLCKNCGNWIAPSEFLQHWEATINWIQNFCEKVVFCSIEITDPGSYWWTGCLSCHR